MTKTSGTDDFDINQLYRGTNYVRKWMETNDDMLDSINWSDFIKFMTFKTPQSYGPRIERRLIKELGFKKNQAKADIGDCVDNNGINHEIKTSLVTKKGQKINIVQIRQWQNTDYYCFAFFISHETVHGVCFKLTHDEMVFEIEETNAGNAHGTKKVSNGNQFVEKAIRINTRLSDKDFVRWIERYTYDFFSEKYGIESIMNLADAEAALQSIVKD